MEGAGRDREEPQEEGTLTGTQDGVGVGERPGGAGWPTARIVPADFKRSEAIVVLVLCF